jgi:hypothetical protein
MVARENEDVQRLDLGVTLRAESDQAREVLVSAAIQADCILKQRQSLRTLRELADDMMRELVSAAAASARVPDIAKALESGGIDKAAATAARRALKMALSLGSRARTLGHLTAVIQEVHAGERQAFGIASTPGGRPPDDRPTDWSTVATADEALDAYLRMLARPRLTS